MAGHVWRLMSDFSNVQFRKKAGALHDLGLTPGHMRALLSFKPGEARPMGSCAQDLGCDASTATWLIDRLEEKGLVERRPSTIDRRVKAVVLTPAGAKTQAKLQDHYYDPPAELLDLEREDLERLLDALTRLAACENEREGTVSQA
jgi:DNA-binding MarR family transcriptional regulator